MKPRKAAAVTTVARAGMLRTAAAALATVALLGGCGQGGGSQSAPQGTPAGTQAVTASAGAGSPVTAPPVTAPSLSPVANVCGPPDAPGRPVGIRTADGVRLAAATAGTGRRGVLLVPELGRTGMCGWWDYAAYLSRSGFRVLMFDHRCTGSSACPGGAAGSRLIPDIRAGVAWLRRAGAARIALVGASQGAAEVIIAAARPPLGVTGVVALSADELTMPLAAAPYPRTAMAAAPRVRLPALFAVAAGDVDVTVADTRRLVAAAGSASKRLLVLPAGSGHGWNLVASMPGTTGRPALARTVRSFLARVTS